MSQESSNHAGAADGVALGNESGALDLEDTSLHDSEEVGEVTVTRDDATFLQGKGDRIQVEKQEEDQIHIS